MKKRIIQYFLVVSIGILSSSCSNEGSQSPQGDHNGTYSVVVTGLDPEWKIRGIKAIREATGLGLADAKKLVEQTPSIVKNGLTFSEAKALERELEKARLEVGVRAERS